MLFRRGEEKLSKTEKIEKGKDVAEWLIMEIYQATNMADDDFELVEDAIQDAFKGKILVDKVELHKEIENICEECTIAVERIGGDVIDCGWLEEPRELCLPLKKIKEILDNEG